MSQARFFQSLAALCLLLALAYFFYSQAGSKSAPPPASTPSFTPQIASAPTLKATQAQSSSKKQHASLEDSPFAIEGELLAQFDDEESYRAFLKAAADRGISLLGRIDALRAVRVSLSSLRGHDDLLKDAQSEANYTVSIPPIDKGYIQPGALGFGFSAVNSIAGELDRRLWGRGIKVAVIDTGMQAHSTLPAWSNVKVGDFSGGLHGHGTAVASLIAGQQSQLPGLAPSASLINVQVANESGIGDTFTLAQGIIAAVDAGAEVLNISMGSYGDSKILRNAVEYAQSKGAVIVASAGNEGLTHLAYPAAYPGVVSVGAIDANDNVMGFSNQGPQLTFSAPGYEVASAWPGEQTTAFTGTSASAPLVSGAIAAVMSTYPKMSATEAVAHLAKFSNDSGPLGADPAYGMGFIDLTRALNDSSTGFKDPAIASQQYSIPTTGQNHGNMNIVVQNRGNTVLTQVPVTVKVNNYSRQYYINQLQPGESKAIDVPIDHQALLKGSKFTVTSQISTDFIDNRIDNNAKSSQLQQARTP